jgi:hypothetical protein
MALQVFLPFVWGWTDLLPQVQAYARIQRVEGCVC